MELREWATFILSATTLEDKLFSPPLLTDQDPGPPLYWDMPSRPTSMSFQKYSKNDKLPAFHEHEDPYKRCVCLHRFAGHELLAVEIMAFALLAYPNAPKHFRKGLVNTLKEEQEHVRLYQNRLKGFGSSLGDHPLNGRFWKLTPFLKTPLDYLSVIPLTLEMANLDFAPHYGASFLRYGDKESSLLMQRIFEDEISHVSFGYHWLKKLKPEENSPLEAWLQSLKPIAPVKRAKGFIFQEEARKKAGLTQDWIEYLRSH